MIAWAYYCDNNMMAGLVIADGLLMADPSIE
jgi:hypothetical protein